LMMHNHLNTFFFGILLNFLYIKVRIGAYKIKYVILRITVPIFPSLVPALYQNPVKTMFSSKIYIGFYMHSIGAVRPIWFGRVIIRFSQLYRWKIIGISPTSFTCNEFPPYP